MLHYFANIPWHFKMFANINICLFCGPLRLGREAGGGRAVRVRVRLGRAPASLTEEEEPAVGEVAGAEGLRGRAREVRHLRGCKSRLHVVISSGDTIFFSPPSLLPFFLKRACVILFFPSFFSLFYTYLAQKFARRRTPPSRGGKRKK